MIDIVDMLALKGFDVEAKTKFVRHQDKRYDLTEIQRLGYLELYQSYQSKPIFECKYVVAFIGLEKTQARFYGLYRVAGRKPAVSVPLPRDFPYQDFSSEGGYFYELEKLSGFEDLEDRVVIEWGKSPLAWHQWLASKEVIEVLPKGYVKEFPGYLDFILTYDELVKIIDNPTANREWHRMLSAVAGIYLITDSKSGKQYVGSAYGESGILGRWANYARSRHGDNLLLKDLIKDDPSYVNNFRYTILRTLPKTLTKGEVIVYEVLYKNKLGTRAHGLNAN